jgi:hypothetical protein
MLGKFEPRQGCEKVRIKMRWQHMPVDAGRNPVRSGPGTFLFFFLRQVLEQI